MRLYSFYDRRLHIYASPMSFINLHAVAQFIQYLTESSPSHPYVTNPSDYDVILIGIWDEQSAEIDTDFAQTDHVSLSDIHNMFGTN